MWLIAVLMTSLQAVAAPRNYAGLRVEVEPEVRVSDRVRLDVAQMYRTHPGTTEWLTTAVVLVDLAGPWRLAPGYRIGGSRDDGDWGLTHRVQLDLSWRQRTDWLSVELRQRYQAGLPGARPGLRHQTRTMARVQATLPDVAVRPGVGVEGFFDLGHAPGSGSGPGVQRIRVDTSVAWPIGVFTPSITYRYEEPIRDRTRARMHRVFLLFGVQLDARKGKTSP